LQGLDGFVGTKSILKGDASHILQGSNELVYVNGLVLETTYL